MKYPNLKAEYEASGFCIETLADSANTTVDLMQDIIDGKEELTDREKRALYGLFSGFRGFEHYSYDYLYAPSIGVFNPDKKRNEMYMLSEMVNEAKNYISCGFDLERYSFAKRVLEILQNGDTIKYAFYRWAVIGLRAIIEYKSSENQRRTRKRKEAV